MIDLMASRYHLLPHQILTKANTVDLYVMDVALSYEKHMSDDKKNSDVSLNTLEHAMEAVKQVNNEN